MKRTIAVAAALASQKRELGRSPASITPATAVEIGKRPTTTAP